MKKKISLGGGMNIDLEVLLRTRLLVQANSGGGKSWLLRRIAEQTFGTVPIIIIDKEGEFSTLREKYGFILAGEGGETPADPRSAGLLAEKLLELHASAICDLYDTFRKNPAGRHIWVMNFCNALLDAPKKYWRPYILIVDEFHTFVPEKGFGESVASESIIGVSTAGRKRGCCLIGATQRLGKVRKDATAELLNRLIGPTFEDIDLERAAALLSVTREDKKQFFEEMRVLEPGRFYALGRALTKTRTLFQVGPVETTHPEMGKYTINAPPPPEKVKALLPQLVDLPKQAEEKARKISDYEKKIRELQHQLRTQKPAAIDEAASRRAIDLAVSEAHKEATRLLRERDAVISKLRSVISKAGEILGVKIDLPDPHIPIIETPKLPILKVVQVTRKGIVPISREPIEKDTNLTNPEQRILDAIAWMESIGIDTPEQPAVSFLAGYRYGGGAFNNPRGALRTKGLVEYLGDKIRLTAAGRELSHPPESALTSEELHKKIFDRLPTPEQRLLKPLLEAYPESLTNPELREASGYSDGGAFNNPRGRLRTLGLIEYLNGDRVKARSILFL